MRKVFKIKVSNSNMRYTSIIILSIIFLLTFSSAELDIGINNEDTPQVVIPSHTESNEMIFNGSANSSQYWGIYNWTDYNMPVIKSFAYNQTQPAIDYANGAFVKKTGDNMTGNLDMLDLANISTGGTITSNYFVGYGLDNVTGNISIDWAFTRVLISDFNTISVDWGQHTLNTIEGSFAVDWEHRNLQDAMNVPVVKWGDQLLKDSSEVVSVDWTNRLLSNYIQDDVFNYSRDAVFYKNVTAPYLKVIKRVAIGGDQVSENPDLSGGSMVSINNSDGGDYALTLENPNQNPWSMCIKNNAFNEFNCSFTYFAWDNGVFGQGTDMDEPFYNYINGFDQAVAVFMNTTGKLLLGKHTISNTFTDTAPYDITFVQGTRDIGIIPTSGIGGGFNLTMRGGIHGLTNPTNRFGGSLIFVAGNSTGSSTSSFQVYTPTAGASGTTDRNPTLKMDITNSITTFNTNLTTTGNLIVNNISANNINTTGNLNILGNTYLQNISANNINTTGNLNILGNTYLQNATANNINMTGNLVVGGNFSAKRPYGMFSSTQTQTIATINTGFPVTFNITEDSWLMTKSSDNANFTFDQSGDYLIELSAVVSTTSGSNKHIQVWMRKNNVNVPRSNTIVEIATSGQEQTLAVPFILDANRGDNFSVMWASDSTNAILQWTQNTSYSPSVPSIIMTITKVSELAGTPYAGGGF